MNKCLSAAVAAGVLLATMLPASAATVFDARSAFEAAAGPLTTETFDTDIDTATSITFADGTTSTKSTDGVPPTLNRVRFGTFTGFVARDGFRTITLDFDTPTTAFGADFSGLSTLMITGLFDGVSETISVKDEVGAAAGFFGLTSSTAFSSVLFTTNSGFVLFPGGAPFGGETFSIDNLSVSAPTPAPIPVPASALLLLGGLGGLGAIRRRMA